MEVSKHFKMYKKGKKWCTMALATVAVTLGATMVTAHADETAPSASSATVTSTVAATATSASSVTLTASSSSASTNATVSESSYASTTNAVSANSVSVASAETTSADSSVSSQAASVSTSSASGDKCKATATSAEANINSSTVATQVNTNSSATSEAVSASSEVNSDTVSAASEEDSSASSDAATSSASAVREVAAAVSAVKNGWVTENGSTYYYINSVKKTDSFLTQDGKVYYFGDDGKEYKNQFYHNWGRMYYFGDDGARYTNQFYSNWGRTYYFGNDGARWTNQFMSAWGNIYYFGSDGARATSTTINLGYGDLTFDNKGILTSSNSFIGGIVNGAIEGWLDYGVLPSLTIAQAILESGWGNSVLAYKYHNLFGIKGSYNGNSVALPTYEVYNGVTYYITDYFRVYPSNNASIHDHALFFVENSRYANLLGNISASAVTTLVRRDGYATDPSYSTSLMSLINNYGLTRYDQIAFSAKAK